MKTYEIYRKLFKFKKQEFLLILIAFFYLFFRLNFLNKLSGFWFLLVFLFEIYLTISIYAGIKKCVYEENFSFKEIFKTGGILFPSIFLYNFIIGLSGSIVYSIGLALINYIGKILKWYCFFVFFILLIWLSFPFYLLLLTVYAPFIIIAENEKILNSIQKSANFIKENFPDLIFYFFPFLTLWAIYFTTGQKYDIIFLLRFVLTFLLSILEILTVKLVFTAYKGVKDERNF